MKLCETLGIPELASNSLFITNRLRMENVLELKRALEGILRTNDRDYWLQRLEAAGVPCGPLNSVADAVENPQIKARNMVVHIDDEQAGNLKIAGNPIKLNRYPDPESRPPAPTLNQHRSFIEKLS